MSVFGVHGDASASTDVAAAPRDYNSIRMSEILTSSAKASTLALLYPEVPLASAAVQGGSCGFVLDFDCALPAGRWPFRSGRTTLSILISDIGAYRQD